LLLVMQLPQRLARQVHDYIKQLLNQDSLVVGSDLRCLAASDDSQVGEIVPLPRKFDTYRQATTLTIGEQAYTLIPLDFNATTLAILLVPNQDRRIGSYIPLIKSFAELLIQQYFESHRPTLDSTDQLISRLIATATPDEFPSYHNDLTVLGYDLSPLRVAILIQLKDFWANCLSMDEGPSFKREEIITDRKQRIEQSIDDFFTSHRDNITAYLGGDLFVVFKSVDPEHTGPTLKHLKESYQAIFQPLQKLQISSVTVGFGNPAVGIKGMIDSYREASTALEFGQRVLGENKSYSINDLGIVGIIADGDRDKKIEFAHHVLAELTNPTLLQTLEAFFDHNLNITETADALRLHRNTVIYRLNQITEILGADPRIFEQAIGIKTALLIRQLFGG
jgi:carbohydrate diacid regulator